MGTMWLYTPAGGTAVSDNFNRANGPLGSNWGNLWHSSGTTDITVVSNAASCPSTKATAQWTANAFANDQYAEAKMVTIGFAADSSPLIGGVGPSIRLQTNGEGGYYATAYDWDDGGGGTGCEIILGRLVTGIAFQIARSSQAQGWATGKIFRLSITGTSLTLKYGTTHGSISTTLLTGTDSNFASGSAGLAGIGPALVDDWYGGDGA